MRPVAAGTRGRARARESDARTVRLLNGRKHGARDAARWRGPTRATGCSIECTKPWRASGGGMLPVRKAGRA
ncbi:hypothetical protein CFB50_27500 [Burkholderia sp. AU33423]|nr:hypothetical protein CFB50_27500 [Burkholderia sp. AU33423]